MAEYFEILGGRRLKGGIEVRVKERHHAYFGGHTAD